MLHATKNKLGDIIYHHIIPSCIAVSLNNFFVTPTLNKYLFDSSNPLVAQNEIVANFFKWLKDYKNEEKFKFHVEQMCLFTTSFFLQSIGDCLRGDHTNNYYAFGFSVGTCITNWFYVNYCTENVCDTTFQL